MSWLTDIFGQKGKIKFKAYMPNGDVYNGKMYIETVGNDNAEIEEYIKNILWVEHDIACESITITGFAEGVSE